MKTHLKVACLYTAITAVLLGVVYPLLITGISQALFRDKANGQLLMENGTVVGSKLIGQPFTGPRYFHSRPSSAGTGYDASASSGSNLGPTSKALADRMQTSVQAEENGTPVPIDLVTTSASGLDPDISPAAALYQVQRVARERGRPEQEIRQLVIRHTTQRQLGILGEPVVHVLELNRSLDGSE
jgi:potassium-transporting ATPase KdpC subunit